VTPLDAILGNQASAVFILAAVGVLLLSAAGGALDYMGGDLRPRSPLYHERGRLFAFAFVGLPAAFLLLGAGGALGALASGAPEAGRGMKALLWLTNIAFVACVVICGLCSPMARHWGLGLAGFAAGLGLIFPLLALISQLGFDDSGLLASAPDRAVFGVTVGAILLAVALAAASIVAMLAYVAERTASLLPHHDPPFGRRALSSASTNGRRNGSH
jgi:hypothetical protein